MKLDRKDIDYIRQCLKKKGIGYSPLLEELIDHVICEAEADLDEGTPSKSAIDKVLSSIEVPELNALQNNTIKSDNYSSKLMLRNTFKMLLRNQSKNLKYSLINIAGLATGFACFIAVTLYVVHETSFDRMFSNSSSIYRITMSSNVGGLTNHIPTTYPTLGPELQNRFGDISRYTRIINYKYSRLQPTFRAGEKIFYEDKVIFADSTFFELFDFPFLEGNPKTALLQPGSVVITKSMAEKYFGNQTALGKPLTFNAKVEMVVTGVLNDLPSQTHLQFDFVIPMSDVGNSGMFSPSNKILESWQTDWFWVYLQIPNQQSIAKIETGINELADEKIPDARKENSIRFYLQALKDIHLHSDFDYNTDLTQNGDIQNLFIFIAIGVLILLISCINFINISVATATRRYKEIGVSKVLGAMQSQLRFQFIFESVIISLASLIFASFLLVAILPAFSLLLGVKLSLAGSNWQLMAGASLFAILTGVLSGIYPALFVSSFDPQRVLKGVWKPGSAAAGFRKTLVTIQLAISIFLIVGTILVYKQMQFVSNKDLGYNKEQIVMLPVRGTAITNKYHAFKNKLLAESSIVGVSSVSEPIGREVQFMSFAVDGQPETKFVKILNVTYDFVKTMGLQMAYGRDFSREYPTDSSSGFVINEAAARAFGWSDAIDKPLDHSFREPKRGRVIGVVKDFNFEPLQKKIDPIIMWFGWPRWYVAVKIQPGQTDAALKVLEKEWKNFENEKPFAFSFLDQAIEHVYEKEQRLSNVFFALSLLSIIMAMVGLYGLVSFDVEQRLMEIGIRKVLGSSEAGILSLVTSGYLKLIALSFVLAVPLTYLLMSRWLKVFAYRISFGPSHFAMGLIVIATVVMITISSKVIYAARMNPTKSLRND